MPRNWRKDYQIVWHGERPEWVESVVRTDMADELRDLSKPSDLIFHTVMLADEMSGPSVTVWGEPRDTKFHAEYHAVSAWETISGKSLEPSTHNGDGE